MKCLSFLSVIYVLFFGSAAQAMTCPLGPQEPIVYEASFVLPESHLLAANDLTILELWEDVKGTPAPLKAVAEALIEKEQTQFHIYSPVGGGFSLWIEEDYTGWVRSSEMLLEPGYAEDVVKSLLEGQSRSDLQWVSPQSRERLKRSLHAFVEGQNARLAVDTLEVRYRKVLETGSSEKLDQRLYKGVPENLIPPIVLPEYVRKAVEGISTPPTREEVALIGSAFSAEKRLEQRRTEEQIFGEGPGFRLPIELHMDLLMNHVPKTNQNIYEGLARVETSVAIHTLKTLLMEALVRRQLHFEEWYYGEEGGAAAPSQLSMAEENAVYMVSLFPELRSYFSGFQKMDLNRALQYGLMPGDHVSPLGVSLQMSSGAELKLALYRDDETDDLGIEVFATIPGREERDYQQLSHLEQDMIQNKITSLIQSWRADLASSFKVSVDMDENEIVIHNRRNPNFLIDFYLSLLK